jgi:formate hydrogenlyase subunit 4
MTWIFSFIETAIFIALAPLFSGWVKWIKCFLQNRRPPPLLQPYRDLIKLMGKRPMIAEQASWVFEAAPYVLLVTAIFSAGVIPFAAAHMPTAQVADLIVLVGFFALGRFFLTLAGMDLGTAFGGMGASREMMIASLAEPAMLMAVFTLAMSASTTNLSQAIDWVLQTGLVLRPSFAFALSGLILVAIAETGRIPVDNPATHLELTMVHEAMILEYSGKYLALIEWASQIKLMLYGVLIANIFFPWGIAEEFTGEGLAVGFGAIIGKLALLGVALPVGETLFAKMRVFRYQEFLGFAYLLSLLGMLSHVILEVN